MELANRHPHVFFQHTSPKYFFINRTSHHFQISRATKNTLAYLFHEPFARSLFTPESLATIKERDKIGFQFQHWWVYAIVPTIIIIFLAVILALPKKNPEQYQKLEKPKKGWILENRSRGLYPLQGLRGVCSIWIIIYHFKWMMEEGVHLETEYFILTQGGALSVTIFFILSGLSLGLFYPGSKLKTWKSIKIFWWKRITKSQPMCWLAIILALPGAVVQYTRTYTTGRLIYMIFANFLNLNVFVMLDLDMMIQPHLWQIQCFIICYLIYPFAIQYFYKMGTLAIWATAMLAYAFTMAVILISQKVVRINAYEFFTWRYPHFLMGLLLATALTGRENPMNRWLAMILTDLGTIAMLTMAAYASAENIEKFYSFAAAPIIILWLLAMMSEEEQAKRAAEAANDSKKWQLRSVSSFVFNGTVVQYLGECSFTIYVFQFIARNVYSALVANNMSVLWVYCNNITHHDDHHIVISTCFALVFGILAHEWIEKPTQKYFNGLTKKIFPPPPKNPKSAPKEKSEKFAGKKIKEDPLQSEDSAESLTEKTKIEGNKDIGTTLRGTCNTFGIGTEKIKTARAVLQCSEKKKKTKVDLNNTRPTILSGERSLDNFNLF